MDCEYYDNGRCNLISNEFAEARCKEDEACVFRKPQEYNDWVDVIRCKDCKIRYTDRCGMFDVEAEWEWTEDNGFCQYGERKES